MADADDLRSQLRRLLAGSQEDDAGRLIREARTAAEARVRSLLTDAYADVLLAEIRHALEAPPPATVPARPERPAPVAAEPAQPAPAAPNPAAAEPAPARLHADAARSADLGWYVYCVIDSGHDPVPVDLDGVDPGHPVTALQQGELVAVVSRVPLAEFGEEPLREHLSDLEWLERTARRHEHVQQAVAAGGTPIPMRLCTIYRDESGVREMLAREGTALQEAIDHLRGQAEWGVKGFADVDAGPSGPVPDSAAGDGAAYMQNRLHQRRRRQEAASQVDAACDGLHVALGAVASDGVVLAPHRPELTGRGTPMIFNASYLVADADTAAFHRELDRLTGELAPLGIELERTGPWPPYNFVPGAIGAAW